MNLTIHERKSIFLAEIGEGGSKALKSLIETMKLCLKQVNGVFTVDAKGISSCNENEDHRVLCKAVLWANQFKSFSYYGIDGTGTGSFSFSIDMENFYEAIKKVKVKETVRLELFSLSSFEIILSIVKNPKVQTSADQVTANIKVNTVRPSEVKAPEDYDEHRVVPVCNSTFQASCQSLNPKPANAPILVRRFNNDAIIFFSGNKTGVENEAVFRKGFHDVMEERKHPPVVDFQASYSASHLFLVKKMLANTINVLIYLKNNLPLRMRLNIGQLGLFDIYIKSQELVQMEKEIEAGEMDSSELR